MQKERKKKVIWYTPLGFHPEREVFTHLISRKLVENILQLHLPPVAIGSYLDHDGLCSSIALSPVWEENWLNGLVLDGIYADVRLMP